MAKTLALRQQMHYNKKAVGIRVAEVSLTLTTVNKPEAQTGELAAKPVQADQQAASGENIGFASPHMTDARLDNIAQQIAAWRKHHPGFDHYIHWLEGFLHEKRLLHSIGVFEKTLQLGERFGFLPSELQRASTAAILHDVAKLLPKDEMFRRAEDYGLILADEDRRSPRTLHPIVGAAMVQIEQKIHDEDILNAIRFHTTARAHMSDIEVLVYIADKIEGRTRDPNYIAEVEAYLQGNNRLTLRRAMLYILDDTLKTLIDRHQRIHPRTISARNSLIFELSSQESL